MSREFFNARLVVFELLIKNGDKRGFARIARRLIPSVRRFPSAKCGTQQWDRFTIGRNNQNPHSSAVLRSLQSDVYASLTRARSPAKTFVTPLRTAVEVLPGSSGISIPA
jgi:hypothetical protein